jgi:DNA-binding PadR family transcriptional regulator
VEKLPIRTRPTSDDVDFHLPLRPAEFLVLAVLRDGPRHGYGIVQEIAARTEGLVGLRPGNLYRVLDRMLDAGLLEVAERRPARELDDERRTYYRITALGRRVVIAEAELLAPIVAEVIGGGRTLRPA